MGNPVVLSLLLSLAVGLFAYSLFVPRSADTFTPNNTEERSKSKVLKLVTFLGGEIYSTLPANVFKVEDRPNAGRTKSLLMKSGNPWNLTVSEFNFFQYISAFLAFIAGWILFSILSFAITIPWFIFVPIVTLFGFFVPRLKYQGYAKTRDIEFKRQLPEALDLLIISLSSGNTFNQALRESLPNMQAGVLKEEFKEISRSLDTGKTMTDALSDFADRSPNESITTFIRAVQEANSLNVAMVDVLSSRADASRQDFFALIHAKTASLESKMMVILAPTLIPALMIVVLAPTIISLISSFGGN